MSDDRGCYSYCITAGQGGYMYGQSGNLLDDLPRCEETLAQASWLELAVWFVYSQVQPVKKQIRVAPAAVAADFGSREHSYVRRSFPSPSVFVRHS